MDFVHSGKIALVYPEGEAHMEYEIKGGTLTVLHTRVPDALVGRGLAGELAKQVAAFAKEAGLALASECTYMTAWLEKHPQR